MHILVRAHVSGWREEIGAIHLINEYNTIHNTEQLQCGRMTTTVQYTMQRRSKLTRLSLQAQLANLCARSERFVGTEGGGWVLLLCLCLCIMHCALCVRYALLYTPDSASCTKRCTNQYRHYMCVV